VDQLYTTIKTLAEQAAVKDSEDFIVDEYAGGNVDDAYSIGFRDGQIALARQLLGSCERNSNDG